VLHTNAFLRGFFIAQPSNDKTGTDYDRKAALAEAQFEGASAAGRDLFLTTPTTLPGALALLRYIVEREAAGDEFLMYDSLPGPYRRSSVALCHQLIEVLTRVAP
jgi:hypothetical protein